ncbi:hypothetical protein CDD83_8328 [Cordyceps sp. RAO-2017]|nr:hypothetical protein CDD83_8328 [Cordyceps sp. RAO-2017]
MEAIRTFSSSTVLKGKYVVIPLYERWLRADPKPDGELAPDLALVDIGQAPRGQRNSVPSFLLPWGRRKRNAQRRLRPERYPSTNWSSRPAANGSSRGSRRQPWAGLCLSPNRGHDGFSFKGGQYFQHLKCAPLVLQSEVERDPLSRPVAVYTDRGRLDDMRDQAMRRYSGCDGCGRHTLWNLYRLKLKRITPAEPLHGPYIAALLIAVAQQKHQAGLRRVADRDEEEACPPANVYEGMTAAP